MLRLTEVSVLAIAQTDTYLPWKMDMLEIVELGESMWTHVILSVWTIYTQYSCVRHNDWLFIYMNNIYYCELVSMCA